MGRLTFTEYFHLLLTGDEPTEQQRFFLDLVLVAIAEHGLMPSNVAARMTLAADPAALQGAVAAGLLGAGPVILGTSGECARLLESEGFHFIALDVDPKRVKEAAAAGEHVVYGDAARREVLIAAGLLTALLWAIQSPSV